MGGADYGLAELRLVGEELTESQLHDGQADGSGIATAFQPQVGAGAGRELHPLILALIGAAAAALSGGPSTDPS